jgi:GntR family phosphonate transport system transcriptional regulator
LSDAQTKPRRTPIWLSIAKDLKGDLSEGRYAPGDRLPTEATLAERFGVNRHTVRHAIKHLVDEGLVRTRRGSGAFVTAQPTSYPLGKRVRFRQNLSAAGRQADSRILSVENRAATEKEAELLGLNTGDILCDIRGLSLADGQPVAVSESLYPLARLPGLDRALAEAEGVTRALQSVGVPDYTRAWTRITATTASATQAVHLQLAEGAPLLRTTSLNVDPDGLPVEYGRTWWAGDRITLTLED